MDHENVSFLTDVLWLIAYKISLNHLIIKPTHVCFLRVTSGLNQVDFSKIVVGFCNACLWFLWLHINTQNFLQEIALKFYTTLQLTILYVYPLLINYFSFAQLHVSDLCSTCAGYCNQRYHKASTKGKF